MGDLPEVFTGSITSLFLRPNQSVIVTETSLDKDIIKQIYKHPFFVVLTKTTVENVYRYSLEEYSIKDKIWYVQLGVATKVRPGKYIINETDGTSGYIKDGSLYRSRQSENPFISISHDIHRTLLEKRDEKVKAVVKYRTKPLSEV